MCVSRAPLSVWSYKLSVHDADFLSRGFDWRDADGDEWAIRRLKVELLLVFLVGPMKCTMLLYCIDIFVLTFGFVNLPNVHGLSSTVRILSSQFFSHTGRHTILKLIEESLDNVLGKHGPYCRSLHAVGHDLREL